VVESATAAESLATSEGILPELEEPRDLHGSVVGGLKWNTLLSVGIQASRFLSSLVLVRLLTPKDYGIAAMALIFSSLGMGLSDLGLGSALIQRRTISELDRSTVFWTTIGIGGGLMLLGDALAWPTSLLFGEPRVTPLLLVVSVAFLLGSLGVTQSALMQRAMRFRSLAIRTLLATFGASGAAVAVAAVGGGAWALVANQLVLAALLSVLLWFGASWRPRLMFSRRSLRDLGGYGANVTGTSILAFLKGNADNILVGRYLGAAALGLYGLAYNVILVPGFRILDPLYSTLFAAFARIQHDRERMRSLWLRASRGIAGLMAPMMLGLVVVAPDFVDAVLGSRWHDGIPVIRILAVVPLAYSFGVVPGAILMAADRTQLRLRLGILDTVLAIGSFALGLQWGIVGVAACFTAVVVPQALLTLWLVGRIVDLPLTRLLWSLAPVAEAVVLMVAACWLCRLALVHAHVPAGGRLAVVVVVGAVSYVLASRWRNPALLDEIRRFRRRSRASEPALSAAG
jgi:PST family polysaccharide transporter